MPQHISYVFSPLFFYSYQPSRPCFHCRQRNTTGPACQPADTIEKPQPVDPVAGPTRRSTSKMATETTCAPPVTGPTRRSTSRMATAPPDDPPHPPPAEAGAATPSRSRPSGFEQLDGRVKELTSSQAELLERIQKLKHNWRSNVETQVKTYQNELQDLKKGLDSEVEQLKSEMKAVRSAVQEEKGNLPAQNTDFRDEQ
uniref:Uncharacterized protein n=1 Tax=Zea mays TaxID=4577 RepID=A0A804MTW8_MAIZE